MTDNEDQPLSELLKPISATKMPKGTSHNIGGREMSENQTLSSQRKSFSIQYLRAARNKKRQQHD